MMASQMQNELILALEREGAHCSAGSGGHSDQHSAGVRSGPELSAQAPWIGYPFALRRVCEQETCTLLATPVGTPSLRRCSEELYCRTILRAANHC
jgi:hypothetical protein